MNVELKRIAEKKLEQLGGDVCGVLVRTEAGSWAAVSEGGRVMWLDDFEPVPVARNEDVALPGHATKSDLIDCIDLMADEFKRIKALNPGDEIWDLCDRALRVTEQNVPVLEIRDRLQQTVSKLLWQVSDLQDELKAARAQSGQGVEPVAWATKLANGSLITASTDRNAELEWSENYVGATVVPLYTQPQPQPAQQGSVPEWAREISENLKTQNGRMTQDPLFVVFQKREIVVDEDYDHDRISWGNCDGEADDEVQEKLNELYDDIDSDFFRSDDITLTDEDGTAEWRRVALKEVDEFVTACFTEVGANDYLKANGHNLSRPHIYVTSLYRNEEMKRMREWLLSATTPQPQGDGPLAKIERSEA